MTCTCTTPPPKPGRISLLPRPASRRPQGNPTASRRWTASSTFSGAWPRVGRPSSSRASNAYPIHTRMRVPTSITMTIINELFVVVSSLIFDGWRLPLASPSKRLVAVNNSHKTLGLGLDPLSPRNACADVDGVLGDLHAYDVSAMAWTRVAARGAVPSPRAMLGFVAAAGRLYLYGGWDGRGIAGLTPPALHAPPPPPLVSLHSAAPRCSFLCPYLASGSVQPEPSFPAPESCAGWSERSLYGRRVPSTRRGTTRRVVPQLRRLAPVTDPRL